MATRSVVCPECGAEVSAGRLSCAACGTLIASVAGSPKRPVAAGSSAATGSGDTPGAEGDAVDAAASSARRARTAAAAEWKTGMDAAEEPSVPPILRDWTGPVPVGVVTPPPAGAPSPAPPWTPPAWTSPPPATAEPYDAEPPAPDEVDAWDARADDAPLASLAASDAPPLGSDAEPSWPAAPTVPGAYVAPAIVPTAAATVNGRPATASSIAAAAVVDGSVTSVPAQPRPDRWFSVPAPGTDGVAPGKAGIFSDLPFRTPGDAPSWAVAVGSLFGAVAFILPNWSANGVMGTQGEPTFTGQWGLANPANLVVFAIAIALLLVTLIPNGIPASIRRAVLPILVAGWFLGIFWTYATSSFGLGWGVDAIAIGGVVLVIGGALGAARLDDAVAPKSKSEPDPA